MSCFGAMSQSEFVVETEDRRRGMRYRQVFQENMSKKTEPSIQRVKKHDDTRREWTKITLKPDFLRCVGASCAALL